MIVRNKAEYLLLLIFFVFFILSYIKANEIESAIKIVEVSYSNQSSVDWPADSTNFSGFRPVTLPFFAGDGSFLVRFIPSRPNIVLDLYASDCIEKVQFMGQKFEGECFACSNCRDPAKLTLSFPELKTYELAVKTRLLTQRGYPFFYVENEEKSFYWRMFAGINIILLICVITIIASEKSIYTVFEALHQKLRSRWGIIIIITLAFGIQLALSPDWMSIDLFRELIWSEGVYNKGDWDLLTLGGDYNRLEPHFMNKPPGAYLYHFLLLRALFGFSNTYHFFILKFPSIIGHLIIGYLLWTELSERLKNPRRALIGAGAYLLNPALLFYSGSLGKSDFFTIALLFMALRNMKSRKFSLYYGLAVLCKHSCLYLLPWLLIQKKGLRSLLIAGCITLILISPFLYDPILLFEKLTKPHLVKAPDGFSWMNTLNHWGFEWMDQYMNQFFMIFFVLIVIMAIFVKQDIYVAPVLTFGLSLIFYKLAYGNYILWILPFTLIVALQQNNIYALFVYFLSSIFILGFNEMIQVIHYPLMDYFNLSYSIILAIFIVDQLRRTHPLKE